MGSTYCPCVAKANGLFRICGDYSVFVNLSMEVDQYPLPNPSEMFATLAGGQSFTKLDLANAFQQLRILEKVYGNKHSQGTI